MNAYIEEFCETYAGWDEDQPMRAMLAQWAALVITDADTLADAQRTLRVRCPCLERKGWRYNVWREEANCALAERYPEIRLALSRRASARRERARLRAGLSPLPADMQRALFGTGITP
jgi:hypothetical protein